MREKSKSSSMWLKVCTAFTAGNVSNMVIVEVNLPSGYAVDKDSLEEFMKSVPSFKRYDTQNMDSRLEVYLESLDSVPVCLEFVALRVFKVGKRVKSYVSVYDYYDTTRRAREFYDPPSESLCELCKDQVDCQTKNCV